jgi:hypothetical protein
MVSAAEIQTVVISGGMVAVCIELAHAGLRLLPSGASK